MIGQNEMDLNGLADEWSRIVIKVLQIKIARLQIRKTGSLFESLDFNMTGQGMSFQIMFSYNLYGKFVDMGVGRNYTRGNPGSVEKKHKQRNRKEWFSRIFYAQVMTLGELARKEVGEEAAKRIISTIHTVKDLKLSEYKSRQTI